MRGRCPSARFLCVAKLKDHRLAFTRKSETRGGGVADAVSEPGDEEWRVVYEIDERDVGRLDQTEGFTLGRSRNPYNREERHVYADGEEGKPLAVSIYIAVQQDNPPPPERGIQETYCRGGKILASSARLHQETRTDTRWTLNLDISPSAMVAWRRDRRSSSSTTPYVFGIAKMSRVRGQRQE